LRRLFALALSCAPAQSPSPAATCVTHTWYAGASDPNAHELVLNYFDKTDSKIEPTDICLLLDDKTLLTSEHRNVIVPRLPLREAITWRGRVAPGKHTVAIFVRVRDAHKPRDVSATRALEIQGDTTLDAHLVSATELRFAESAGVPIVAKNAAPIEDAPVPSAKPAPLPPTWYTPQ